MPGGADGLAHLSLRKSKVLTTSASECLWGGWFLLCEYANCRVVLFDSHLTIKRNENVTNLKEGAMYHIDS